MIGSFGRCDDLQVQIPFNLNSKGLAPDHFDSDNPVTKSSLVKTLAYGGMNADGTPNPHVIYATRRNTVFVREGNTSRFDRAVVPLDSGFD